MAHHGSNPFGSDDSEPDFARRQKLMRDEGGLKPCPFCGGEGCVTGVYKGMSVKCVGCGAEVKGWTSHGDARSLAIAKWNARSTPADGPVSDGLREALERIASCESHVVGDVVDIARKALATQPPATDTMIERALRDALAQHIDVDGIDVTDVAHDIAAALRFAGQGCEELWRQDVDNAPQDGTEIEGLYPDGSVDLIFWVEEGRHCILGPRAGSYPPGWCSRHAANLPVEEPLCWRPKAALDKQGEG